MAAWRRRLPLWGAVAAVLVLAAACGGRPSGGAPTNNVQLSLEEYKFVPDKVRLRAGDTVTVTLVNNSGEKREHEFMVGRDVMKGGAFGDKPVGYMTDFFAGLEVEVLEAQGVKTLAAGEAKLTGEAAMPFMGHGGMPMGAGGAHQGFMVQLEPGGKLTFRFTVPADRAGEWEIGCFAEDGQHYTDGMKATLVVVNR